jgi:hypothetical protein
MGFRDFFTNFKVIRIGAARGEQFQQVDARFKLKFLIPFGLLKMI